ncbi:MAG: DUF1700 domain-containing protein [Terriglobales bacterium]
MMNNDAAVNDYLAELRTSLRSMTLAEREDIVEEIRTHIRERAELGAATADVLQGLGPADELAAQYRTGMLLREAASRFSPLLMLHATLRWAMTGVQGFLVCLLAFCGYLASLSFVIVALLKPIFPRNTGLWIGPGQFNFGTHFPPPADAQEWLGIWIIPVALILAFTFFILTTKVVQFLIARFKFRPSALSRLPEAAASALQV